MQQKKKECWMTILREFVGISGSEGGEQKSKEIFCEIIFFFDKGF
jgi:hypothetical protein